MATKVEQPSGSTSATSSVAASSPKISMFGKKTGFVIPKNKLSGSLVPIVRGGSKSEIADAPKEESSKQTRKTKWGIDLTQDNAVRRGRALAYQTRAEQITNQLESRTLDFEDDHGSEPPSQTPKHSSSDRGVDKELEELLQLERREAIGECIKLNPSYKAPPGYKPVLREAKVPVPLKAYPNINFIGLILGPDNSTKKRLEEETGAKIQTRGTKAGSGEKVEVNLSDDVGAHGVYEELYVHVSAETYEKVDSAVALVELLVTPVSGKPAASTDSSSVSTDVTARNQNQVEVAPAGYMMPMAAGNLGIQTGPPPQGLYLPYSGPWQPPNLYMRPAPSFAFMPNAIPMANAPQRFPPSNVTTFNAPPVSGAGPTASPMLNADVIPIRSQPPVSVMQQPYTHEVRPQNPVGLSSRPFPVQQPQPFANAIPRPNTLPPPAFASGPSLPAASSGMSGTSVQALPQPAVMPQTGAVTGGLLPNMPPPGNPYGWSGASSVLPARMTNMTPMPPRMMPDSSRPVSSVTLPPTANGMAAAPVQRPAETRTFSSPAPGNPALQSHMQMAVQPTVSQLTPGSTLSQPSAPLGPRPIQSPLPGRPPVPPALQTPSNAMPGPLPAQASGLAPPAPVASQPLPSTSLSQVSSLARPTVLSIQSSPAASPIRPGAARVSALTPGSITPVATGQGLPQMRIASPQPAAAPLASVSGSLPNLPSTNIFRPQRPSSSDFTFQPQKPQASTSQGETRPSMQLASQNPLSRPQVPPIQSPPVPHPPSFRAVVHNLQPQPGIHGFARPNAPISNQTVIQRPSQPAGFRGNPNIASPPPFVNPMGPPGPRLLNQALQRAPPGIGGSQSLNMPPPLPLHGSLPVRPGNLQQIRNTPVPMNQPAGFAVMSRPTSGNHGYTSNVNQIYDPFSPTSIPSQQGGNAAKSGVESRQQDTDAEYEDLMASVGVK
ncbi:uncharacterized protein LOC116258834 [Nymphaea colorata]|nr:uncharacterized protein LOC116258834 [Nymphaea colorata]XP_031492107.1 uncharacterized protein LOC116258834 [Nymphaea colorata]